EQGSQLLRPTDFKGDGEGGLYLLTYQRAAKAWKGEKAAPQPPAAIPPVASVDVGPAGGGYSLPPPGTGADGSGLPIIGSTNPPPPAEARADALEILKDRVLASDGTHGHVRLDEGKSPRQIRITMGKQPEDAILGIYELKGDRLTIATCKRSAKLIPTGFEPD